MFCEPRSGPHNQRRSRGGTSRPAAPTPQRATTIKQYCSMRQPYSLGSFVPCPRAIISHLPFTHLEGVKGQRGVRFEGCWVCPAAPYKCKCPPNLGVFVLGMCTLGYLCSHPYGVRLSSRLESTIGYGIASRVAMQTVCQSYTTSFHGEETPSTNYPVLPFSLLF